MSVVFTGTNQGTFVSTGQPVILQLPTGVDWIWVYNQTQEYAAGADQGVDFYWQLGYTQGRGTQYTKTTSTNALSVSQIAAGAGFYLVNNTVNIPGPSLALQSISDATPPVVSSTTTGSAINGSIVRIFNTTGATQLGGLDFTIGDVTTNTSFSLINMAPIAAATTGTFRVIPYNPYFYPPLRYITGITVATAGSAAAGNPAMQSNQALVTLSVTHQFTVGQNVRFIIPTVTSTTYGMTQLNGLSGSIIAVYDTDVNGATNTIRVDIDVSGFTAFAFPLTGSPGFTPAQVIPIGESTVTALNAVPQANILGDATQNEGFFGIQLQAGANSPAGSSSDVIYWVAGKSFNT